MTTKDHMAPPEDSHLAVPVTYRRRFAWRWYVAPLIAVAASIAPHASPAQTVIPPADADAIYRRLEQQDAEILWLRSQVLEMSGPIPPPRPAAATHTDLPSLAPVNSATGPALDELENRGEVPGGVRAPDKSGRPSDDGGIDASKEKWTVKMGGHVQLDYILWADADPAIVGAENYFNYRRLRLVADGTGYGQFDFRLQLTHEPGQGFLESPVASPEVKDAYLSMNDIPWIGRFRIGNFFVPFSLEQVTNDTNNLFNERSIPTQGIFAVDREIGVALYNHSTDQSWTWTAGMFFDDINDTIKTRLDSNQGSRLSGRITWVPYYDEPSNGRYLMHTGVGVLYTHDHDEMVRFRARPQVQRGPALIDSGILRAGSYATVNLELALVWGPVTLQNEAFLSRVNMIAGDDDTVQAGGAYSHLSYFLTGENRIYERFGQHGAQFARNKPYTNFSLVPEGAGWGAWEAKVRWSYLNLTDVDRGQYNDLTVGFNWYWSDRTRIMFDWIHPVTTSQTVFGATESDLIAMRFDFNW